MRAPVRDEDAQHSDPTPVNLRPDDGLQAAGTLLGFNRRGFSFRFWPSGFGFGCGCFWFHGWSLISTSSRSMLKAEA